MQDSKRDTDRTVFWTLWEGGGMIWENGIKTCIISYKKLKKKNHPKHSKMSLKTYSMLLDACCQAVLVTSLSIMRIKFLIKIANINQLSIFSIQS